MFSDEMQKRFGDQDLVGGVILGTYREGKLAGGMSYEYEEVMGAKLVRFFDRDGAFLLGLEDLDEGQLKICLQGLLISVYDKATNKLTGMSLNLAATLEEVGRLGKMSFLVEEQRTLSGLKAAGLVYHVATSLAEEPPNLIFYRTREGGQILDQQTLPLYLNDGTGYEVPALASLKLVVAVEEGRIGFRIYDRDGRGVEFSFASTFDATWLPSEKNVARFRPGLLMEEVFPGLFLK